MSDQYTYDRIVCGSISVIIMLYILVQSAYRIFYLKHKFFTVDNFIHFFCFIWVTIRAFYFFLPDFNNSLAVSCSIAFLFYTPFAFQFAIFSLLLLYFAQSFSKYKDWDKELKFPWFKKEKNFFIQSGFRDSSETVDDITDWRWNSENMEPRRKFKLGKFQLSPKKRHWVYLLYFAVNTLWFFFVLGRCSFECYSFGNNLNDVTEQIISAVFHILTSLIFFMLMLLLIIYGVKLIVKNRNDDVPMSLKLSKLSISGVIVIILINTICFVIRGLFDIILITNSSVYSFFELENLRETKGYGIPLIIAQVIIFEVVPILSVLFFFFKVNSRNEIKENSDFNDTDTQVFYGFEPSLIKESNVDYGTLANSTVETFAVSNESENSTQSENNSYNERKIKGIKRTESQKHSFGTSETSFGGSRESEKIPMSPKRKQRLGTRFGSIPRYMDILGGAEEHNLLSTASSSNEGRRRYLEANNPVRTFHKTREIDTLDD